MAGLLISYHADWPTSPTIVLALGGTVVVYALVGLVVVLVLGAVGPAPTDLATPGTPVLDLHDPHQPDRTVPAAPVAGPRTEEVPA